MALSDLRKKKSYERILGVDASTNSIAFCIIEDGKALKWGQVDFEGNSVYERILDAKKKVRALKTIGMFDIDILALEAAVVVRSTATGLKMAYVFGAIISEIIDEQIDIIEVHPIEWQSFIGNKNFTKAQKEDVRKQNPGRSDNWIKSKIREMRKRKTIEFVKTLGVDTDNDNVADAAGIAWFVYSSRSRQ